MIPADLARSIAGNALFVEGMTSASAPLLSCRLASREARVAFAVRAMRGLSQVKAPADLAALIAADAKEGTRAGLRLDPEICASNSHRHRSLDGLRASSIRSPLSMWTAVGLTTGSSVRHWPAGLTGCIRPQNRRSRRSTQSSEGMRSIPGALQIATRRRRSASVRPRTRSRSSSEAIHASSSKSARSARRSQT